MDERDIELMVEGESALKFLAILGGVASVVGIVAAAVIFSRK